MRIHQTLKFSDDSPSDPDTSLYTAGPRIGHPAFESDNGALSGMHAGQIASIGQWSLSYRDEYWHLRQKFLDDGFSLADWNRIEVILRNEQRMGSRTVEHMSIMKEIQHREQLGYRYASMDLEGAGTRSIDLRRQYMDTARLSAASMKVTLWNVGSTLYQYWNNDETDLGHGGNFYTEEAWERYTQDVKNSAEDYRSLLEFIHLGCYIRTDPWHPTVEHYRWWWERKYLAAKYYYKKKIIPTINIHDGFEANNWTEFVSGELLLDVVEFWRSMGVEDLHIWGAGALVYRIPYDEVPEDTRQALLAISQFS
jgi:hypothetical protein